MLSTDYRLKLVTDTFASQKISAFMLSPGVINPRDCDEQAELSPVLKKQPVSSASYPHYA